MDSVASGRLQAFVTSLESASCGAPSHSGWDQSQLKTFDQPSAVVLDAIRRRREARDRADEQHARDRRSVEAVHLQLKEERRFSGQLSGDLDRVPTPTRTRGNWQDLFTPVHQPPSVNDQNVQVMQQTRQPTEDPSRRSQTGHPPPTELMTACAAENVPLVTTLLDNGQDVNEGDGHMTALHVAAATGHTGIANILLSRGAKCGAKDVYGQTALHVATSANASEVVFLLLQDGANVDIKRTASQDGQSIEADIGCIPIGWTPLHGAAYFGYTVIAEYLICAKANIASRPPDGRTALHVACEKQNVEMIQYLLHYGADPEAALPDGRSPLQMARAAQFWEAVEALKNAGAVA
jgi:ankyrin repeat protein